MANARTRARWIGVGLVATIVAAACEIPTAAPYWKTKWEVPAESTTIAVTNFLPAGVTLAAGGGALDRKSTRLNSSHLRLSRMPSSA